LQNIGCQFVHEGEARKMEFQIFKETTSLGHFKWNDKTISGLEAGEVNVEDLNSCVHDFQNIPLINADHATKILENDGPLEFLDEGKEIKRPIKNSVKGVPSALGMKIAKTLGLSLNDLDFTFGGCVLGVLGEKKIQPGRNLIVQRFNGTLSVRNYSNYTWKENEIGSQFESFIINGKFYSKDDNNHIENLTYFKVANSDCKHNYSILCMAEIDGQAVQPSNNYTSSSSSKSSESPIICELKCSNPKFWGCKVPLQMISNNSKKLIYGEKRKIDNGKFKLVKIHEFDIHEVIRRNNIAEIRETEENILYCLKKLKDMASTLEENKVYLLKFDRGTLTLERPAGHEYDNSQIRKAVVNSLLQD